MSLTQFRVEAANAAARQAADAIGVPMNIAVLDGGAYLKGFVRMDGALLGSIDVAIGKAKTAVLFGMHSEAVGEFSKPGGGSPGLELTNGTLVVFAGGIPIKDAEGAVIGAVGITGGAVAQDIQVAQVAAAAAQKSSEKRRTS
jgi:uncharacterized protein GlcG (DUF336 family)